MRPTVPLIHTRVIMNTRRPRKSARTETSRRSWSLADSASSPAPTRTVETLRITSEAVPSAREWALEKLREASVTGPDRLTTTATKATVSTISTTATGQA